MIATLTGVIQDIRDSSAVLDVSGVGYEVMVGPSLLSDLAVGNECRIYTYLAIRDTAHELYGFADSEQLDFFKKLLTISGVGPKSALHILSLGTVSDLCSAIARGDTTYLTKVAGIGKKTADRIVIELKNKVGALADNASTHDIGKTDDVAAVILALEQFGYTSMQSRDAAVFACKEESGSLEDKVKCALVFISS